MNKSILIVTPYFAPQSHAAVFRAYKLAKYLPRFGWTPYVVTVDCNYLYNEDPTLLDDLPAEVKVTTARHVEPSLRGLRMALGGRDRTFAALKREETSQPSVGGGPARGRSSAARLCNYLLQRWAQVPDAHWTWYVPAVRAARELIRRHDIPLVFTSANPYTSHRIGLTLQREGCKWVADLRDPHTYCHHMHSEYPSVYARQRHWERAAALGADAVTVAAAAIKLILSDSYGESVGDRTHFIPTGLDEELLGDADATAEGGRPRPFPYLLFSGEFLPDYGREFFDIFAESLADPEVAARGAKLLIIGRLDVNRPRVEPILRRLGLGDRVEFVDHVPQRELYRLLRGAEAGILLSSRHFRWWCLYAKLVDFLALRKPVVALVPDPSEARLHLGRAGLGVFLDGDRAASARVLADFLAGRGAPPRPVAEVCDRFLADRQVRSFVDVFESVLGVRPDDPPRARPARTPTFAEVR